MRQAHPLAMLAVIGTGLVVLAWAAPSIHRAMGGMVWYGLIGLWAFCAWIAARLGAQANPKHALLVVLGAAALMRIPLFLEPPYLSSDMYRYVWDGRVQNAGINPYLHVPAARELAHLRDASIYPLINRADYAPTIYMPAAQLLFRAITGLSDSIPGMKLGLLAFEGLAIAAMISLLRRLALPTAAIAAYAWHPMPVWEIAGNAHLDAALLGLMMASLVLYVGGRVMTAGVIAAIATFIKPTALLLFPIYWRRWDWRLPALLTGIAALLYVPFLSAGTKVLGFLGGYVVEEGLSSGDGFRYLAMLQHLVGPIPFGGTFYAILAGGALALVAVWTGLRAERTPESALSSLAFMLTLFMLVLTPHYPWYYLALGPLLVLTPALTPWVLMTGGFLLYDVIEGDRLPPFGLREGLLHLAALAAFAFDLQKMRTPVASRSYGVQTS